MRILSIKVILVVLSALIWNVTFAQTGTVRGSVFDQDTGEPIIYGNVILENTTIGGNTDLDGFYTIPNIPVGEYMLVATYIGYDTVKTQITIKENSILSQNINLTENSVKLSTVAISAKRQQAKTEVQVSKISVSPRQIQLLPSTGAEPDIAQYLQVLPGVISTGDQGGQIFIRGGSPIQNRIMIDGITIFNPFHSIGFFSVFETEILRNVDVLTGGFNAEHGGRISAIVDIKTREGNKKRFGGVVSANPFIIKGLVEGPIVKLNDKGSSVSFVATTKRSIIEQTSPSLYGYASNPDSLGLPYQFQDTYAKLSYASGNGSKVNLFGFDFTDEFNDPQVAKIGWGTRGGGLNFNLVPGNSNMILAGTLGFSDYDLSFKDSDAPRTSGLSSFNATIDFTFFGTQSEYKYGFDMSGIRTDFEFINPFGLRLSQFQNTTEISTFFKYRKTFEKLVFEPSFRLQYYASLSTFSPEPRLGIKYNMRDNLRFKLAGGLYSQNLISTSNERDVVNLFVGFLSAPEKPILGLDGSNTNNKIQTAAHAVLGVEYDLTENLLLNVEGYYKDFNQLIILNRNKISASDSDFAIETGDAKGIDFSLKYETPNIYMWATYSYAFVNRFDGTQTFPTAFDRRHNINFLTTYQFGGDLSWQASVRWNMGSGFPFTKTQGFYNYNPFLGGVGTDYVGGNPDNIGIIYDENRNGGRLPYYHRLDVSVQKSIEFSRYSSLDIIFSVTNAYDRDNIFYFDRVEYTRVNQLPIIPSAGVKFKL